TNLHSGVHCLGRRWAHPVNTLDAKRRTESGVSRPNHHRVVRWIEARHIQRRGCRYAQSAPPPPGVKKPATGGTHRFTGCIDHAAWLHRCRGQPRADEGAVITVRNKADLLAFGLLGHLEPQPYSDLTHLLLAILTERQERVPQLLLGQIKEKVGLIFL